MRNVIVVLLITLAVSVPTVVEATVPPHERDRVDVLRSISEIADEPWTNKNEVELLVDGGELYPARLEMIRNAQRSIDLIIFLWCDDEAGRKIARELARAADRGVRVRVMVDFFNLTGPGPVYEILENAGIRPLIYNPPAWGLDRINDRVHEKLMVVDGDEALVGGANLCDEYMIEGHEDQWHELELRVRGTVASRIQLHMDRTWNFMAEQDFYHRSHTQDCMAHSATRRGGPPRQCPVHQIFEFYGQTVSSLLREGTSRDLFLYQQPYRDAEDTDVGLAVYTKLVESARDELFLIMPYLIPAPKFKEALIATAERGVDVTILSNSEETNDMGYFFVGSAQSNYEDLLDAGINIYESQEWTVHAKAMLVDSHYLKIGSHNFTNRSFEHNGESAVLTLDRDTISRFQRNFDEQLESAQRVERQGFVTVRQERIGNGIRSSFLRWLGRSF